MTATTTTGPENGTPTRFTELLEDYTQELPRQGEIVEGEILHVTDDALFVDIGAKRDAIVPAWELADLDETLRDTIAEGGQFPVYITNEPRGGQELIVSLKKGLQKYDWDRSIELLESGELTEQEVVGYNKGGLLVRFGQLTGFVPNSHVPDLRHLRQRQPQQSHKAKMVGTTLFLKVIEVDNRRKRLVLSATHAQDERRKQRMRELKVGQTVAGEVTALVKFGAFVDVGEVEGLVHISNLAHHHVQHPSEVLEVGEKVEVLIEKIDLERGRLSLNRKVLLPSPMQAFAQERTVGDLLEGVITNVVDFGLFVEVAPGVEGLVHVSEMLGHHSSGAEGMWREGDRILVRVISIDADEERLGLSMQRVSTEEEIAWMQQRAAEAAEAAPAEVAASDIMEPDAVESDAVESDAVESDAVASADVTLEVEDAAPAADVDADDSATVDAVAAVADEAVADVPDDAAVDVADEAVAAVVDEAVAAVADEAVAAVADEAVAAVADEAVAAVADEAVADVVDDAAAETVVDAVEDAATATPAPQATAAD